MDAVKLLGALLGNNATGGNLLGSVLGGNGRPAQPQQPQGGGAAELLRGLLGGGAARQQQPATGGGGLGDLLGSVLGGGRQSASSGGGNILGGLLKAAVAKQVMKGMGGGAAGGGRSGGGLGLLEGLLGGGAEPEPPAVSEPELQAANDQATILIRAMCNAAKSDGQVDAAEQQNIIGRLGEVDQQEIDFVRQELSSPLDVRGFASSVPRGMEAQVYALSVMTVKVDTREEVQYLTQLAQALGLDQQTLDAIHQQIQ